MIVLIVGCLGVFFLTRLLKAEENEIDQGSFKGLLKMVSALSCHLCLSSIIHTHKHTMLRPRLDGISEFGHSKAFWIGRFKLKIEIENKI